MFKKILIANRGEIACRVIRACRDLGIHSVALYSEADRHALHVRMADEAYFIGPSPARESYLRIDKILDVARKSGADAVHPGYGFLSERAEFAEAVNDAGLVFIGPPPDAIRGMGDKVRAKQMARQANVPLVPGTDHEISDPSETARIAEEYGYPVLLKASAGGGGKGMRVIRKESEISNALSAAIREATGAFGYGGVYIEKLLENVKHIEFQMLADNHGNIVYLGERECSVQRRHQKMLEEAPSLFVDPELRQRMGEAAVRLLKVGGYVNAGTVEFLVAPDRNFYFIETNARLQVEHPITEMVTGIDVVTAQIRIAAGEPLDFTQDDITQRGHAIEMRITAEDPANRFLPSVGTVSSLQTPSGPGVRLDSAVFSGFSITPFYDSMIAKLVVYGATRDETIRRALRALEEFRIAGVKTSIPFHQQLLLHPDFQANRVHTTWLETNFKFDPALGISSRELGDQLAHDPERLAALAATLFARNGLASAPGAAPAVNGNTANTTMPQNDGKGWKEAGRRAMLRQS